MYKIKHTNFKSSVKNIKVTVYKHKSTQYNVMSLKKNKTKTGFYVFDTNIM